MRRIMLALLLLALGQPAQAAYFEFVFISTDNTSLGPPFAGSPLNDIFGGIEFDGTSIVLLYDGVSTLQGFATGLVPAGAAFQPTDNLLFVSPPQLTIQGFALEFAGGVQTRLSYNPDFGLYQQTTCTVTGDCTATLGTFRAEEVRCISCPVPEPAGLPVLAVALGGLAAAAWATGRRGSAAG